MPPPVHDIVLLGIGHTNAHILKQWRMSPLPGVRLTCISDFPIVTYSGMLPGVLAGQYPRQRMEIDLVRLCAAAGARLIVGEVVGLDRAARRIDFQDRPSIPYDLLSIGMGSRTRLNGTELEGDAAMPIKPMQTFLSRFERRLAALDSASTQPIRVAVVGGGAGGVEIAFCVAPFARRVLGPVTVQVVLIQADDQLLVGVSESLRHRVSRALEHRGVELITGRRVVAVRDRNIFLDNDESLAADVVLLATGAAPPPLLEHLDLPRDARGFLLTDSTLQSKGDDSIFVVGDSGTIESSPTPKAGVYAVRQGPILWDNLIRRATGLPPRHYHPQRGFLKLLNLGDGTAIAEYRGRSFSGKWCWRLKDFIDGRFMDMYQDYAPTEMGARMESAPAKMHCAGCGGKVGGSILSRVLERLEIPPHPQIILGLDHPDDAAVLRAIEDQPVSVTVDFFTAPFDDPYTLGRIAVLHAASDCFAVGGIPIAALALVTLPFGSPRRQEQQLYELLAGSLHELRRMGATLAGGHTIEGEQLMIGFTMVANQPHGRTWIKGRLAEGDRLVLSKPLGTGVLLAAHMRAACRADWYQVLIDTMLQSNQQVAEFAAHHGVTAMTDITGFGLAGHLLEMLQAGGRSATLNLRAIPLLPGTAELLDEGLESTLAPDNRRAEAHITVAEGRRNSAAYRALFDPQTSGGLLCAVPQSRWHAFQEDWRRAALGPLYCIGHVSRMSDDRPTITVTAADERP